MIINNRERQLEEGIINKFFKKSYLHEDNTIKIPHRIKESSFNSKIDTNNERVMIPLKKIIELRREIDICDKILIETFQRRMTLVMEVLDNKRQNNLPIFNPQREEEIIQNALLNLKNNDYAKEVEELLKKILKISRRLQSEKLFPYNIVLAGFMGAGKSTVGRDLARKLEMDHVDTDAMIEERMGISIKEIFEKYGEGYFRELEKNIVAEVSKKKNTIIFCGGGVVLKEESVINLRRNGRIILLKAKPTTLYERIKQDDTRPVLQGQMSLDGIENLLKQRNRAYAAAADIVIETDNKTVDEISIEIITELYAMDQI